MQQCSVFIGAFVRHEKHRCGQCQQKPEVIVYLTEAFGQVEVVIDKHHDGPSGDRAQHQQGDQPGLAAPFPYAIDGVTDGSLGDAGERDIQSAGEEKKRLMDVEQRLKDFTEALADFKRPA